jgi:hypothetical protein
VSERTWNYRIVRYRDPDQGYGLHEVHYSASGREVLMSVEPAVFVGETALEVADAIARASGALARGVFDEPAEWAGGEHGE